MMLICCRLTQDTSSGATVLHHRKRRRIIVLPVLNCLARWQMATAHDPKILFEIIMSVYFLIYEKD